MTLAELTTPFQRREIIDYAADHVTVRCRRYEMQHVAGPLYKGRERANRHGESEFNLFLVYDGIEKGLLYGRSILHPEWYTVEKCLGGLRQSEYDTLEHFLEAMEKRVQSDRFVGNAMIEFIRQFDPPLAERYAQHRLAYYARKEEEGRKRALAMKAAEEAERVQWEATRKAERAKLHGWADDMNGLRFGRVMSILSKKVRVENAVMHKYEFVLWAVQNGWNPAIQKNDASCTNLRPEYRLQRENMYYPITKTEFDYAEFLLEKRTASSTEES